MQIRVCTASKMFCHVLQTKNTLFQPLGLQSVAQLNKMMRMQIVVSVSLSHNIGCMMKWRLIGKVKYERLRKELDTSVVSEIILKLFQVILWQILCIPYRYIFNTVS